jgi:O-antigen/teichoic acid export membrane protein
MRKKLVLVATFFAGQGSTQLLSVIFGLVVVRLLTVESYAQFSLALGFQVTLASLMDLGYAGTIIPLVGERFADPEIVGAYVAAAKHHRDRIFFLLSPFAAVCFWLLGRKHHWSLHIQLLLLVSVLVQLYFGGRVSYYSAPLMLRGDMRKLYRPQVFSALLRCLAPLPMRLVGALNGWSAALLNAVVQVYNSIRLRRSSLPYICEPRQSDPSVNREMLRFVVPAMPAIIFSAFQGQISLYLITLFGKTVSMAEVAALGRVGQMFSILVAFNVVLIEPRFARLPREDLPRRYMQMVGLVTIFCAVVSTLSFRFPFPLLWFLGPQYSHLSREVGWVVLGRSLDYLATAIWLVNRSRKWVFWSGTIVEIGLTSLGETAFVFLRGVATTHDAILILVLAAVTRLLAHSFVGAYGFANGPRAIAGRGASDGGTGVISDRSDEPLEVTPASQ